MSSLAKMMELAERFVAAHEKLADSQEILQKNQGRILDLKLKKAKPEVKEAESEKPEKETEKPEEPEKPKKETKESEEGPDPEDADLDDPDRDRLKAILDKAEVEYKPQTRTKTLVKMVADLQEDDDKPEEPEEAETSEPSKEETEESEKASEKDEKDVEDVREALKKVLQSTGRDQVVAILGDFDAGTVSDLDKKDYSDVVAKAEEIVDAK